MIGGGVEDLLVVIDLLESCFGKESRSQDQIAYPSYIEGLNLLGLYHIFWHRVRCLPKVTVTSESSFLALRRETSLISKLLWHRLIDYLTPSFLEW